MDPPISEVTWLDAVAILNIPREPNVQLIHNVMHHTITANVNFYAMAAVVADEWRRVYNQLKDFPGVNESDLRLYVNAMFTVMPPINELTLRTEYSITSPALKGRADYVYLKATGPKQDRVGVVMEAKRLRSIDARAQLYIELSIVYAGFPIYGVIATVNEWVFVYYDGTAFIESFPAHIAGFHDVANISVVLRYIYCILEHEGCMVG